MDMIKICDATDEEYSVISRVWWSLIRHKCHLHRKRRYI